MNEEKINKAIESLRIAEKMDMEIYELQENGEVKPLLKSEYICKENEIEYYA
jgi:hypothetical protein|nr:MAG TPA: hypothetical protein [Caudoviricetes sp.]